MFQNSPQNVDPTVTILTFLLWGLIFIITVVLIRKSKLTRTIAITLLITTFVVTGIILGAMPNTVTPINMFFVTVGPTASVSFQLLLPLVVILLILLATTLLFGRIYCGYSCPLGAMQELASKILFKSNLQEQKMIKFPLNPSPRTSTIVRWIYFVVFAITGIVFGLEVSQYLNLFMGFQIIQGSTVPLIIIPVIFLIVTLVLSFFIYRPWCRFFCPFGALAGVTSKFSWQTYVRTDKCTDCGLCEKICPTQEAYRDSPNSECYYCNRCVEICPHNAIVYAKKINYMK